MILAVTVGTAADTGAKLGIIEGVRRPIITLNSGNHPVHDVHLEQAAPAAVVRRTADPDDTLARGRILERNEDVVAMGEWEGGDKRGAQQRAPLEEAAST